MVLAVGDIDPAVGVGGDVVHDVELAGIGAGLAPGLQQLAVRRVLVDAGIAVAVRHVDLALRRQRGVGAAVERLAAHERRRLVRDADGQQHLAVGASTCAPCGRRHRCNRDCRRRRCAGRGARLNRPSPQLRDEIAVAVEHHHRMVAAIEDVDAVLAVDRDRGDVGQAPAVRQLRPVLHHAVAMLARAENGRHVFLPAIVFETIVAEAALAREGHGAGLP